MAKENHYTEQQLQDPAVMALFHQGDERAFTSVYHALHQRLYFYALQYVGEHDAEDITAETFIALWQRKARLDTFSDVAAFLHVAVRNRCLNILRHQRVRNSRQAELLRELEGPDAAATEDHQLEQVRVELVNLIYEHIDQLPERMREVFLLSYRQGLKPAAIAERLGISTQTVSNQKLTAIKLLRKALDGRHLLGVLLLLIQLDNPTG